VKEPDATPGGSAEVSEATIRARGRMPAPHSHDGLEETVYGVEGVSTWTGDGTPVDGAAGQALCTPRGTVRYFDNQGEVDAKALCVITAGALGLDHFREGAAVFAHSAGGPPDLARIGDVMRRHGLTPAARPPPSRFARKDRRREQTRRGSVRQWRTTARLATSGA